MAAVNPSPNPNPYPPSLSSEAEAEEEEGGAFADALLDGAFSEDAGANVNRLTHEY